MGLDLIQFTVPELVSDNVWNIILLSQYTGSDVSVVLRSSSINPYLYNKDKVNNMYFKSDSM
jgi:hypothetical protein